MLKKSAVAAMDGGHPEADASYKASARVWLDILLESVSDGIFLLAAEGHKNNPVIVDVSHSIEHWTRIHKDQICGRGLASFLRRQGETSASDWSGAAVLKGPSGPEIPVDVTLQKIPADDSIVLAFVRRQDNMQRQLARALEEKTAAENACKDFFARVNHDLRTPLNGILGFSEIMQKGIFGEIEHDQYRGYASDIYEAGLDLKQKIDELLEINNLLARPAEVASCSFASLLNAIADKSLAAAEEKAIDIRIGPAEALSDISGDKQSFARLIAVVIENAIQAAPPKSRISIVSAEQDGCINLMIKDQGLPPDSPVADIFTMAFAGGEKHLRAPNRSLASQDLLRALCQKTGCLLETSPGADGGHITSITIPRDRTIKI